jgi:hypothetical protein
VDISNNDLSWSMMSVIGQGLSHNHTILGFHVKGNMAQVDSFGFIQKEKDRDTLAKLHVDTRLGSKHKMNTVKKETDLSIIENCWLCEGWSQVSFEYTPGVSDTRIDLEKSEQHDEKIPINLCLDCDHYSGDLLYIDRSDTNVADGQRYYSDRMVPPGNRRYFFSIAG